jgi:hypothetical protein
VELPAMMTAQRVVALLVPVMRPLVAVVGPLEKPVMV